MASSSESVARAGVIECIASVTLVRAALLILGYRRTRLLLDRVSDLSKRRTNSIFANTSTVAEIVDQLSNVVVYVPARIICLERSLALYLILRRRGLSPHMCIGVRPLPLVAHAWVELAGAPLNEDPDVTCGFPVLRATHGF